tara:strand:- start:2700 stop:4463 length:1764 start_codon:yes stop_codon:yes gene_type:complete
MNILIEPLYIGLIQTFISFSLISGIIFIGNFINSTFFKKYNFIFFDLLIGLIIISQLIKIFTYLGLFNKFSYFLSYFIVLFGIYNFKQLIEFLKLKNFSINISKIDWIIIVLISLFFLISIAPPSMADALNYHYGVPLYLIQYNELPNINTWFHSAMIGNGEMINSLAIIIGSDNFGSLIQFSSLILFFKFLKKEVIKKEKINFIIIFIISSPTILQLISGPKFLLLPQLMTATALYLFIKLKNITVIDFIFIGILLIGATQFKLSFIISGSILGILTFYKAFFYNKMKILLWSAVMSVFFFLPTLIWNLNHVLNFNLINIFAAIPNEMIENLKLYRENKFFYPINLLIPDSIGKISAIIGFQFLILFFLPKKTREFKYIILIAVFTIFLHYLLGMNVSRIYFEFILWLAISIIFIDIKKEKFNFYTKLILPQLLLVFCFSLYFAVVSFPSVFSIKSRDNFMTKNSLYYEAIKWVNITIPENVTIFTNLRSVAFLKNKFITNEPLVYDLSKDKLTYYFDSLKKNKINYFVFVGNSPDGHQLENCLGNKYVESKKFIKSTRNPFNRNSTYIVSIYKFNHKKLPNCAKF